MRRWLAQKLCPEAFEAEKHLWYVRNRLDELKTWCGYGFPEIAAAVEWVRKSERIHFMPLADYHAETAKASENKDYSEIMVGPIDRFREEISDRFDRRPDRTA